MTDWRDLTLETLPDWPLRYQLVVCLLVMVAVVIAGKWWLLSPLQAQQLQLSAQESVLRSQIRHQQTIAGSLPQLQVQTQQLQTDYRHQAMRLPGQAAWTTVLGDIELESRRSGVRLHGLNWQQNQQYDWYAMQPVQFELSGSYAAVGQFFAQMAAKSWLLIMDELEIQPDEQVPGELRVQGTAQLYRAAEEVQPENSVPDSEGAAGDRR
ncbi:type 4a pilus biogenesis protein PilO [Photobacterium sp. CCB-ST2H9]|uniref:type 4a pilus biogenesis protein PilO n=1 Tax=Photobacterium sp. CCB-ST2H9 TaxID=2912855 RepID=UPI00200564ED|nr:type 4a pilus biogenesis protein PilO [Photobacterium sp. CCB-ST2H9]UTM57555.1 type 4a pilus biogenesis protein PilO [Photobacterium sp. CCB-ST2H9]